MRLVFPDSRVWLARGHEESMLLRHDEESKNVFNDEDALKFGFIWKQG